MANHLLFPHDTSLGSQFSPTPAWETCSRVVYVQSKLALLAGHSATLFRESGAPDYFNCLLRSKSNEKRQGVHQYYAGVI